MNHYERLGLNQQASQEEIKKAFRALAKTKHPDVCADLDAEEIFKLIKQAYEVLSDEQKKAAYDAQLRGLQVDMSVFEMVYDTFWTAPYDNPHAVSGKHMKEMVSYTVSDWIHQVTKEITIYKGTKCSKCEGYGFNKSLSSKCVTCQGKRHVSQKIQTHMGSLIRFIACESCDGYGYTNRPACAECKEGVKHIAETIKVKMPEDMHNTMLILNGQGHAGENHGPSGDLMIQFVHDPTDPYKLKGYDVYLRVILDWKTAISGGEKEVMFPSGEVRKYKVYPGVSNGNMEVFPEEGLYDPKTKRRGGFYVEFSVATPSTWAEVEQMLGALHGN